MWCRCFGSVGDICGVGSVVDVCGVVDVCIVCSVGGVSSVDGVLGIVPLAREYISHPLLCLLFLYYVGKLLYIYTYIYGCVLCVRTSMCVTSMSTPSFSKQMFSSKTA